MPYDPQDASRYHALRDRAGNAMSELALRMNEWATEPSNEGLRSACEAFATARDDCENEAEYGLGYFKRDPTASLRQFAQRCFHNYDALLVAHQALRIHETDDVRPLLEAGEGFMSAMQEVVATGPAEFCVKLHAMATAHGYSTWGLDQQRADVSKTTALEGVPGRLVQPIHFEDYDGRQFERLVFAYLLRTRSWRKLDWYGQVGDDCRFR